MTSSLTRAQTRMWFLQQLDPDRTDLNLVNGFRLAGKFDLAGWNQAVTRVISRHAILQSRFFQVNDNPAARALAEPSSFSIRVHNLEGSSPDQRENSWRNLVPVIASEPFDLACAPLLRIHLAQLAPNEHALLLVMHHIISDGDATAHAFITEIAREVAGQSAKDPVPAIDDDGQIDLGDDLAFWRQYLEDAPQRIDLGKTTTQGAKPTAVAVNLPRTLVSSLTALAHKHGFSLFDCLLAAYGMLLRSHAGQDTILIGWPVPNRPAGETDIGYWGQPLPIRFEMKGSLSFLDVMLQTAGSFQAATAHKYVDFTQIVQELATELTTERDVRYPLFQVLFDFQPALKRVCTPTVQIDPIWWDPGFTTYEWSLFLYQKDDGSVSGRLEYQPGTYEHSNMQQVAQRYELLLASIASNHHTLAHTPLTPEDQRTLKTLGTGQQLHLPEHATTTWFETQARLTPNAVALEFNGQSLTYSELNGQANQIAHALQEAGVQAGQIIGVSIERSMISIVTLLAIWKTGGVFLPLDPAYPTERLSFMLQDCHAKLLITSTTAANRTQAPTECKTLVIDELLQLAQNQSHTNPELVISHGMLSYIIYTSGSTGTPKGIAMVHRNLVNLVAWQLDSSAMRSELRVLQFASLNFDICFQELMTTWCAGGTVILIDEKTRRDSSLLLKYLIEHRINRLFLPFVALQQLALAAQGKPIIGLILQEVLTAGEQLRSTPALRELFNQLPHCKLLNQYGPSEAHVITSLTLPESTQDWAELPSIGFPLANTEITVVDGNLYPTPPGTTGELLVCGAGLASGYINREQQTNSSFVDLKILGDQSQRWYRTGDLVRWLEDGSLQFISRLDQQHKVRGFRVDLGEIEVALNEHDGVRESLVTVRGKAETAQLIAYVVARTNNTNHNDLEKHRVEDWSTLWENTYQKATDSDFNLAGWTSSYDEQAIAVEQMRQWRDDTVSRIMALNPRKVLEIGCGTGLLLCEIAPACEKYAASDFSHTVIGQLSKRIEDNPALKNKVTLCQGEALNPGDWPAGEFDTIILNSVLQLFPSADYLKRVLSNAIKFLAPGGRIFVGDVQNFDLLQAYHAGVAAYRHRDGNWQQAHESWARNIAVEDQLLVSPDFFKALPNDIDAITQVKINLKSGDYCNELTKFRYDVVLETKSDSAPALATTRLSYEGPKSLDIALQTLTATGLPVVIERVPNARIQTDLHALRCLLDQNLAQDQVAQHINQTVSAAIDPQACWDMSASIGAHCLISWSDTPDCMDVCFSLNEDFYLSNHTGESTGQTSNDPINALRCKSLVSDITSALARKLPAYMLPHHIIVLESLPVKTNGKVDMSKLPAPINMAASARSLVMTEAQAELASLWEQTLGLSGISADDDFFALGGHSLLAVELIYRIRQQLGIELSLSELFQTRTVERLSQTIEQRRCAASDSIEQGVL